MIGCIATAPACDQVYCGTDLGPFGGNMDYNRMGEGVTLYLPVFHPGGLLTMGDGERTGTVDVISGFASAAPAGRMLDT
jgi:amidase